jgi:hypothetical protein
MVCLANHGTGAGGTDLRFFTDFSGGFNPKGLKHCPEFHTVPVPCRTVPVQSLETLPSIFQHDRARAEPLPVGKSQSLLRRTFRVVLLLRQSSCVARSTS